MAYRTSLCCMYLCLRGKLLWLIGAACLLFAGCSAEESEAPPQGGATAASQFAIPFDLQSKPFPAEGRLRAFVVLDGAAPEEMQIVGDNAEYRFSGLPQGRYRVSIVFEFDHPSFGDNIRVAEATKDLDVQPGDNRLSFLPEDYATGFDDDEDGVSNLDELASDRHPRRFDDSTPSPTPSPPPTSPPTPTPTPAPALPSLVVPIPAAISVATLPGDGRVRAYVSVDGGELRPMTLGDAAALTFSDLALATYTLQVIFAFDYAEFGEGIPLAVSLAKAVTLVAGENRAAFSDADFDTAQDADDDGESNLDELAAGRNPLVFDDTAAPLASVLFPPQRSLTRDAVVVVRGTSSDAASEVVEVRVNGVAASTDDAYANWTAQIPLDIGDTPLQVEVVDAAGNRNASAVDDVHIRRVAQVGLSSPKGVAYDAVNNRALITDSAQRAIIAVDLGSGEHSVFSANGLPDNTQPFSSPENIVIDPASNRALVLDRGLEAVIAVDLASGGRSLLLGSGIDGAADLALDAAGERLLLPASGGQLYAVSLSGELLATFAAGVPEPRALVISGSQALVLDANDGMVAVGFSDYATVAVSNNSLPNGDNPLSGPSDMALDADNNRVVLVNRSTAAVLSVDLGTGARSVLSDASSEDGTTPFFDPLAVAVDSANNRALVVDAGMRGLISVDLSSGARRRITDQAVPANANPFFSPGEMVFDAANNRLLLLDYDRDALFAVSLQTGARSLVAENVPGVAVPFDSPASLLLLPDASQAMVLNRSPRTTPIMQVDTASGIRSLLPDGGGLRFVFPRDIALDRDAGRFLIIDSDLNTLVGVDQVSGQRSVVSNSTVQVENPFSYPSELSLDPENNRAYVGDNLADAIFTVDLDTGAREILWPYDQGEYPIGYIAEISPGLDDNQLIILDAFGQLLVVDIATGERQRLNNTEALNDFSFAEGLYIDSQRQLAYISDSGAAAVFVIDLVTQQQLILSH